MVSPWLLQRHEPLLREKDAQQISLLSVRSRHVMTWNRITCGEDPELEKPKHNLRSLH